MDKSESIKEFKEFLCMNRDSINEFAVAIEDLPADDDWIQDDEWDEIYDFDRIKHKLNKAETK